MATLVNIPPRQLSKTGIGSALTQTTTAKDHVSISIPANKGGRLIAIETQVFGTLETVVNTGGLVQMHNSAEHWEPLDFYTTNETTVTAGGLSALPFRFVCNKPLPGNSTVTVDYTPQDNQSQKLAVTLYWIPGKYNVKAETFSKTMIGGAVTATTRATAGTILVPGGHSGNLVAIMTQVFGTVETVVNSGGLVEVDNDAIDIKPQEFYTGKQTTVGAALGGGNLYPLVTPEDNPCIENSTFTFYYTPQDDQSQKLAAAIVWES